MAGLVAVREEADNARPRARGVVWKALRNIVRTLKRWLGFAGYRGIARVDGKTDLG